MPTEKQIQAARQNGAKSRGPKTPEGKQSSTRNATTHGLLAAALARKNEDKEEFLLLAASYFEQYEPVGPTETHLIEQMISCTGRKRRAWETKTALTDDEMGRLQPKLEAEYKTIAEPTRAAHAWKSLSDNSNSLRLLTRYEASLHRRYLRAIKTLTELQAARRAAEAEHQSPPPPEPQTQNRETNPSPPPPRTPASPDRHATVAEPAMPCPVTNPRAG
jgi:hypothetical protein